MARRKRQTNTFNLSFLDIMSCGLGAVILMFLLVKKNSQEETIEQFNLDNKELEFLRMNLYYGHKCRRTFMNVKGFTVGSEDYKKCVLRKGRKN